MANAAIPKKGLTTFGWLALGGAALAVFSNKDRRDKAFGAVKGFTDKLSPKADATGTTTQA